MRSVGARSADSPQKGKRATVVRRLLRVLDSVFLARVGRARTLGWLIGFGLALVVAVGLVGADVVRVAGWVPVVCFVVWALIALLLAGSWLMSRQPSTLASPFAQLLIAEGLPGASAALLKALATAESKGREFIAEAAICEPVDNQVGVTEFAQTYAAYEGEVAALISSSDELDERWQMLWQHKPSWAEGHMGPLLEPPFYGKKVNVLVKYMAQRNRQLGWMIGFLQGGSDRPVRYVRHWVAADEARTHGEGVAEREEGEAG